MEQTKWAHLPNAKHIDWVIASLKSHPKKWLAAMYAVSNTSSSSARDASQSTAKAAAWQTAYDMAWAAAWDAAYDMAWDASKNAAYDAVWDEAWDAAIDAIAALIAWDDCAYMIESEVDELKILAKLGDQKAILLLPACIVYNETKMLTKTSVAA